LDCFLWQKAIQRFFHTSKGTVEKASFAELRREHEIIGLNETGVAADPLAQFAKWFEEGVSA